MTDASPAAGDPKLLALVEIWHTACTDFLALVRDLPETYGDRPTDLLGWSVRDNVAHTAHLEAVLAGAPEETVEVAAAPHLTSLTHYYTEQGVLARRGATMAELADELEHAVATRYGALRAEPPTDADAPPPKTPGDAPWSTGTLLANRPLDVWMHDQDVRRAVDRPGGYDSPAAAHTIARLGAGLPMVVGKRVAPPAGTTVRLVVPDFGRRWTVTVGDDGRAGRGDDDAHADTTITLGAEDFVVLAGGRRGPEATDPRTEGDADLAARLLASMAVTP